MGPSGLPLIKGPSCQAVPLESVSAKVAERHEISVNRLSQQLKTEAMGWIASQDRSVNSKVAKGGLIRHAVNCQRNGARTRSANR